MFKRNIKAHLKKALKRSPVVLLNGARQVGKSTLVLEFLDETYTYFTFDDEMVYLAAKSNPTAFIAQLQKPAIIDEVQRVPEIFLAIKRDVDTHREPGRYLLTGSANPLLIPRLGDSLAGRMEIIDLMPLSQGEINGVEEHFIDHIFSDKTMKAPKKKLSKKELYKKIILGGYPLVQKDDEEGRLGWMRSYLNLILQRDIKDLAQIEKVSELPHLLKILAARSSNLVNVAEIARETKMNIKTTHRYIALLETIFLINLQNTWSNNRTSRFTKAPKLYLVDSGLLAYLLDINLERALDDAASWKVLENFVVNELRKQITWSTTRPELYHFRTVSGEEVNIVLENRSGKIVGIEVKSSEKVTPNDFKGLKYLQEKAKNNFIKGIILYNGTQCIPFGPDLFAVPIHKLWID